MNLEAKLQKQLHLAAEQGNYSEILSLLKSKIAVDSVDDESNTALHVAAANNRCRCIEALVRAGACVDAINTRECTPLMQAAGHSHAAAVSALIKAGADVTRKNILDITALGLAASVGDVAIIRVLVDAGASCTEGKLSPLLLAGARGHTEAARVLLDRGARANSAVAQSGVTPLMASVMAGAPDMATLLVSLGADANRTNALGYTALQIAHFTLLEEQLHPMQQLLEPITTTNKGLLKRSSAVDTVCEGDMGTLRSILVHHPQQAKAVGVGGVTALMVAAVLGREDAAVLLLQHGADPEATDDANGWTPLLHALHHRHVHVARALLQCGADITVTSPSGHTVLEFALEIPDLDIIKAYVNAMQSASAALEEQPVESAATFTDGKQQAGIKKIFSRISSKWFPRGGGEDDYLRPAVFDDPHSCPTRITGTSILPRLPARPLHDPFGEVPFDQEDFLPASLRLKNGPLDMTSVSLRWSRDAEDFSSSTGSSRMSGLFLPPGHIRPRFADSRILLRSAHSRAASSCQESNSSSGGSSLTASTNTTVKTKRSLATMRPRQTRVAEHLTLSLGSRQLTQVLEKLSLSTHHDVFADQDIDFEAFVELTSEDLQELGVADQVTRVKIMRAIQSLRKKL